MALNFNDIFDRVTPYTGLRPLLAETPELYARDIIATLSLVKADNISLYDLLDTMSDVLEDLCTVCYLRPSTDDFRMCIECEEEVVKGE